MTEICDRCASSSRALYDMAPEHGRALANPPQAWLMGATGPVRRDAVGRATEANEWRALRYCGPCKRGRALKSERSV
jgi:hypothetical protein